MRIKLNCLSCGHPMDLGEAYQDYAGEVRCWGCQALLDVELRDGKLLTMRTSRGGTSRPIAPVAGFEALLIEVSDPAGASEQQPR